ncbi:hypothetical protein MTQ58_20560, partial [Escherichia coli]|nr:hypothetical protein [Escherichia coli]
MSLSIVHTRAALGVNAPPITVEVHISKGLPGLTMVGLPETTAKWHLNRSQFGIRIDHDLASISDHSLASQSIT